MLNAEEGFAVSTVESVGGGKVYDDAFFQVQSDGSYSSASCVLPLVLAALPVNSAIDVGCGVGTWASKVLELGISDVLAVDGDYVNRELLRVPESLFSACDLTKTLNVGRRFDLAICLEVAEHLAKSRAEGLIEDLVRLAPAVLFSAAIPGQGGTNHINEQFLSYWADLFRVRDYVLLDIIRPAIWKDERCEGWYRQNIVLFVHRDHPAAALTVPSGIDYVHPYLYGMKIEPKIPTLRELLREAPGCMRRSLKNWLSKLAGSRK